MKIPLLFTTYLFVASGLFAQMDTKVTSGVVAYDQGDYEQAVEYLNEALSEPNQLKEKNVPKAYYYRAEARMKAMVAAAATGM